MCPHSSCAWGLWQRYPQQPKGGSNPHVPRRCAGNQTWSSHAMGCYLAIKKGEVMICATTRVNIENIMLTKAMYYPTPCPQESNP